MLRIATCQMTSGPDLGANLQIAESLIRKAAREGANLALLPEMFTIMSNDPKDVLHAAERYQDGPVQKIMAGLAKSLGIWIVQNVRIDIEKDVLCINGYQKLMFFRFMEGKLVERPLKNGVAPGGFAL